MRTLTRHRRWLVPVLTALVLLAVAAPAFADDPDPVAMVNDTNTALNIMWMLLGGFLVFFMQAGFALVETGFTRAKNVAHTMMMNMMVFCIGAIGYFICGFAFQFGAVNVTWPEINGLSAWAHSPVTLGSWVDAAGNALLSTPLIAIGQHGILGGSGFFLAGLGGSTGILAFFLFQMVFMDTAATIPTGSMAERLKFSGFVLMSLWVSMVIYPMVAGWIWGGGWLQNIGRTMGLGNGAVDFAGSGPVHTIGGAVALAGAMVIGPRIGKFNKDGSANAIPGHNIPMGVLGTIILFFGWFGFNPGSSLGFLGGFGALATNAAVNTLLAGSFGGVAAMTYMWLVSPAKKPDPGMSVNGILAGLVAITAPCAFVDPISASIIGIIGGVLVCLVSVWLEQAKIDDPVGAVPVHFANGIWGVISVGLFANGNPNTAGWNGVSTTVTGLFFGGGFGQLAAQIAEAGAIVVTVWGLSYLVFLGIKSVGLLRSDVEHELQGLDIPEMGSLGYPKDFEPSTEAVREALKGAKAGATVPASGD